MLITQTQQNLGNPITGFGPLGLGSGTSASISVFNQIISTTIAVMTIVAFIWFTFILITGAISVITAGGDKAKVAEARGRITTGLIGLVIVIAAIFLIDLIGYLLGIDFLQSVGLIPFLTQSP
jgi:hypothetical protein